MRLFRDNPFLADLLRVATPAAQLGPFQPGTGGDALSGGHAIGNARMDPLLRTQSLTPLNCFRRESKAAGENGSEAVGEDERIDMRGLPGENCPRFEEPQRNRIAFWGPEPRHRDAAGRTGDKL